MTGAVRLASIHVYPIKGAAGFTPKEWAVDARGLREDRRWMVVEPSGGFITQREEPRLALLRPGFAGPDLIVEGPKMPALATSRRPGAGRAVTVGIWRDQCSALLPDPDADAWLSDYLGRPACLAWMPETSMRPVDPEYAPDGGLVGFQDGFPFLLLGEASLEDLNRRLATPVPMNRFRPNLVVSGGDAFEEDRWRRIRVGEVVFDVVKPCDRCVVTTVDQRTGTRGEEPLRTLASYRRRDGKVLFGQNLLHQGVGELRVGAEVQILDVVNGER